jgi:HEPN domain-containing protein
LTPKFKTKDVSRSSYANYLKRAEECFHAAQHSLQEQEWNAAAINAIHSCIAACDAMCVYFFGKRHSGDSHNDAAVLFKTIKSTDEYNTNTSRLLRILRMKNMAEYEDRLVYKSEAEKVFKDAERFLEFVKKKLPQ